MIAGVVFPIRAFRKNSIWF
jgi:hypothetical protein